MDLVLEVGHRLVPVEIKANSTPRLEHGSTIRKLRSLAADAGEADIPPGIVIYGGDDVRPCGPDRFVPWHDVDRAVADLV